MPNKISLIIPVKDEEKTIGILLDSLNNQTRQPDEVVITDGGSRDGTVKIIESYAGNGWPIKLVRAGHAYPGRARNLAIEASSHGLIAMTDAGIKLDTDWLEELARPAEEDGSIDVVYGSYEPVTDSFFKECLATVCVAPKRPICGVMARSHFIASSLIKKTAWKTVGGFPDFRAAEDRIFMEEIRKKGFKVAFAPRAKVFWFIPAGFKETFKRFSMFSMHDIIAGRVRDWHYPVLRMYVIGLIFFLLGIFFSPYWFLALVLGVLLRASGLIIEKREAASEKFDMRKLASVSIIMIWIDAAMFWGILRHIGRLLCQKERGA